MLTWLERGPSSHHSMDKFFGNVFLTFQQRFPTFAVNIEDSHLDAISLKGKVGLPVRSCFGTSTLLAQFYLMTTINWIKTLSFFAVTISNAGKKRESKDCLKGKYDGKEFLH